MPKFSKKLGTALLFAVAILPLFFSTGTRAERTNYSGLILSVPDKITPVLFLKGEPGRQIEARYSLTDDYQEKEPIKIYPAASNFSLTKDGKISLETETRSSDRDIAQWISFPQQEISINQGERRDLSFTVKVPENAAGGTFSALLTFSRKPANTSADQTAVGLNDQLGLPVFVTIAKDVDFKGTIEAMSITGENDKPRGVFTSGDAYVHVDVNNAGNIYIIPMGDIFVYKKDKTKAATIPFNTSGYLVQPGNTRKYSFNIQTNGFINENERSFFKKFNFKRIFNFKFGRYNVSYQAIITPSKEAGLPSGTTIVSERTESFFVLPIQVIIFVLILLALVTTVGIKQVLKWRKNSKFQHYRIR